jgi:hypothetical protein
MHFQMKQLNMNDERKERVMKATYTEENFEEYYRKLVEDHCAKEGMTFRLNEWDGARENMRDDAFGMDEESDDPDEPTYTDEDLIDEYLYFCLTDDLDGYTETSDWADNFNRKYLNPEHNPDTMTWTIWVYREGDKPYSHYDTDRMDKYVGTYTFDKANCMYHFEPPVKEA